MRPLPYRSALYVTLLSTFFFGYAGSGAASETGTVISLFYPAVVVLMLAVGTVWLTSAPLQRPRLWTHPIGFFTGAGSYLLFRYCDPGTASTCAVALLLGVMLTLDAWWKHCAMQVDTPPVFRTLG